MAEKSISHPYPLEKMSRLNLPTNSYFNGGRSIFLFLFAERPSRLSCTIQTFSCVFFMLGTPLVGFSVILVAYDRLYAVIKPAIYYKSGAKQAWIGVTGEQSKPMIKSGNKAENKYSTCYWNVIWCLNGPIISPRYARIAVEIFRSPPWSTDSKLVKCFGDFWAPYDKNIGMLAGIQQFRNNFKQTTWKTRCGWFHCSK